MVTVRDSSIPDVKIVESRVFTDERGYFLEAWNAGDLAAAGLEASFVQDNLARSRRGVLRGLHYQLPRAQGKLVRVTRGEVFDVAVDLRRSSPTFGKWVGERLSAESGRALWIPPGFAHGYLVLSEWCDLHYKCTAPYASADEHTLRWDDPVLAIEWPLQPGESPILSVRDSSAPVLAARDASARIASKRDSTIPVLPASELFP